MRMTLRALPRPIWALIAGTFINRFGSFVYAFLVLYLVQHGFTAPQAGLAVGGYGGGALGAALLGGKLADQYGRRTTILLSMCGSAVCMLALSQAQQLLPIVLLAGAAGLTTELYRPASSALLADLIPREQRVTGFALYRFAINLGVTIGPAVGGLLAARSFFLLFVGDALTSLLFAGVALVLLPNRHSADQSAPTATLAAASAERRTFRISSDRRFLLFLSASILIGFIYVQSDTSFALQVRADGFSTTVFGYLLSLNALLIILFEIPLTRYTRRWAPHVAMALGMLLLAGGFGLAAVAMKGSVLALCVVIWTFGEMIDFPIAGAHVANLAPSDLRGRYAGAQDFAGSIGRLLGSALGTVLFSWNTHGFWLLCGLLGATAAIITFVTQRPVPAPVSTPAPTLVSARRAPPDA